MPIITAAWASEVATLLPSPTYAMVRPASASEPLLQREQVGHGLARVLLVGERVDDVQARRGGGELLEDLLRERADDDRIHPALEIARDVGRRLAPAERHVGGNQDRIAAQLAHRDLEGHPRAQRRLVEEQRDVASRQAASRRGVGPRRAPASAARPRAGRRPVPPASRRPATGTSAAPALRGWPARAGRVALSGCTRAPVLAEVDRLMFDTPR